MVENSSSDEYKSRTGIFHLRILGGSTQSTYIALQYGVHLLNDQDNGKYDYDFTGVAVNFKDTMIYKGTSQTVTDIDEGTNYGLRICF